MARDEDLKAMSKRALEREVIKLRELLSKTIGAGDELTYESGVNDQGAGFVTFAWGAEIAQLSPDEVRQMALGLIESAEAAENDAALVGLFSEAEFGLNTQQIARTLMLVRDHRAKSKAIARGDAPGLNLAQRADDEEAGGGR